ncbi:C39 family peptidase [Mucilaginibacter flavidus]|uniref:C39 family peptidase n=1 Tax=Mucilaginibacter flavidus TaxID=2949309 RepID=UPI0020933513|nr:C39 family peptidase [Mucilaginibacter flavidus]MCO5946871.1 hypothetical protein [Mucilaginibacter flavidus]
MKKIAYLFALVFGLLLNSSCKKDSKNAGESPTHLPVNHSLEKGLVSFSINGELVPSVIDTLTNTITATMPDGVDIRMLTATYTLAANVNATVNSTAVAGSAVIDLTSQPVLTVSSPDNVRHTSFTIVLQTELQYFGVGGITQGGTSLNKNYDFYYDQFDGSPFQAINCGPTVATMAIKWADPFFNKKPADARQQILPSGGWWYTSNIQQYLNNNGVNSKIDTLVNVAGQVAESIDKGYLVILCLDMYSVPFNSLAYQHTQKFYPTSGTGWGHFLLVKGYKQTVDNTYLEVYDPYSRGLKYNTVTPGQYLGQDRYYVSSDIKAATDIWWPYAIIVAPKGKVVKTTHLKVNSITKPIPDARGQ